VYKPAAGSGNVPGGSRLFCVSWNTTTNGGIRSPNTHTRTQIKFVRITHPTHPLHGQDLPVTQQHRKGDGTHLIEVQLANSELRLIPRDWTDLCPSVAALPGSRFVFAQLCRLRQQLDVLLLEAGESEILAAHTAFASKGECDEHREPTQVVQTDGERTWAGGGHSGTDGLAPTGQVSEG